MNKGHKSWLRDRKAQREYQQFLDTLSTNPFDEQERELWLEYRSSRDKDVDDKTGDLFDDR